MRVDFIEFAPSLGTFWLLLSPNGMLQLNFGRLANCALRETIKFVLIENVLSFCNFLLTTSLNEVLHVTFDDVQVAHFVKIRCDLNENSHLPANF